MAQSRRAARRRPLRQPRRARAAARRRRDVPVPPAQGVDARSSAAAAARRSCLRSAGAASHNPSITWIGHATMLVRMDGVTFLTDPIFSERASPVSFAGPKRLVPPGVPLDALPPIDFVARLARPLRPHRPAVDRARWRSAARASSCRSGSASWCASAGGAAVELDWWQSAHASAACASTACRRSTSPGARLTDGNQRLWAGWVVEGPTRRFYHAGDTGYFDGFARDRRAPRPDRSRGAADRRLRSAVDHAVRAHEPRGSGAGGASICAPARAVGMHYGTFDLTDEPLDEPPRRFHAEATRRASTAVAAWTLNDRRDARAGELEGALVARRVSDRGSATRADVRRLLESPLARPRPRADDVGAETLGQRSTARATRRAARRGRSNSASWRSPSNERHRHADQADRLARLIGLGEQAPRQRPDRVGGVGRRRQRRLARDGGEVGACAA